MIKIPVHVQHTFVVNSASTSAIVKSVAEIMKANPLLQITNILYMYFSCKFCLFLLRKINEHTHMSSISIPVSKFNWFTKLSKNQQTLTLNRYSNIGFIFHVWQSSSSNYMYQVLTYGIVWLWHLKVLIHGWIY